jgi:hypothetical protein
VDETSVDHTDDMNLEQLGGAYSPSQSTSCQRRTSGRSSPSRLAAPYTG